jgi:6-pyruvoyltetrahydropterin/6-carboxytetrahydropterin synthase
LKEQLLYVAAAGFEAARRVTLLPEGHRARRLHGHSFIADVRCALPSNWADFPGGEIEALKHKLTATIARLDYRDLNSEIEHPTDENLARWVRKSLDLTGIENVGIQSTRYQGVDLDQKDRAHIWRRYVFESAHQLPHVPAGHQCGRMHGHGFEVILHAEQQVNALEMGMDYDDLDRLWAPLYEELDHVCLNDIPGLENPTSELISSWIWAKLKPQLPDLSWVTVYETASCGAHFDGTHYRIWKEMSLDSALKLKRAPQGDKRLRVHGHTYTLRLHLSAEIDKLMGWTVDFGDVKNLFTPIFKRLDHQPLHEISGLADTDTASVVKWLQQQALPLLPQLDRIDLYETRGCGAILSWGPAGPALPV